MKRRKFLLAAVSIPLSTSILFGKSQRNNFFEIIKAQSQKFVFYSGLRLNLILDTESKGLIQIGYKLADQIFISSENPSGHIIFFPFELNVKGIGNIDRQYIVLKTADFENYTKITVLGQDFMQAIELASSRLKSQFDSLRLKKILLPERSCREHLYLSREGMVKFTSRVYENKKNYHLEFETTFGSFSFNLKDTVRSAFV